MIDQIRLEQMLRDINPGSLLFVSYRAGRIPTPKAILEAERAVKHEGIPRRYALGTLTNMWIAKNGDTILTMYVDTRDTLKGDGSLKKGAYRSFNPSLGELLFLEVIEEAPIYNGDYEI